MPRRGAKAPPSGVRPQQEPQEGLKDDEQAPSLPRAGDAARQIGKGFIKMAEVIDECPPLAKLFEGGVLERRFQEVFQVPSARLMESFTPGPGAGAGAGAGAGGSEGHGKRPSGSSRKGDKGAAATTSAAEDKNSSSYAEGARGGGRGGGTGSPVPREGVSASSKSISASFEVGTRGRRGARGSRLGVEADDWPGLEQALKASEREIAALAGGETRGSGKDVGMRSRPADHKAKDESAKRGRKPLPPVPSSFGLFPPAPAPPPRRAAAQALHRISSLSSSAPPLGTSSAAVVASPQRKLTPAAAEANEASEGATTETAGKNTKDKMKAGGGVGGKKPAATAQGGSTSRSPSMVGPQRLEEAKAKKPQKSRAIAAAAVAAAAGSKIGSSQPDADAAGTGSGHGGSDADRGNSQAPGAGALKGGAASAGEPGGAVKRRKTDDELLSRLDARVFRFVPAGKCRDNGCDVRKMAHCHRGPGCDCTRNSNTYLWPSELQSMLRHQERHHGWNMKPAFGKRVMVEFEKGVYYPGTINTEGDSARDLNHSNGRWGVLFDDCTRDRFFDGAEDVMVSNQPRPMSISEELYDYYLKQRNGHKLLVGVKVVPGTQAGQPHAYKKDAEKKRSQSKKHTDRKSLHSSGKLRKESSNNTGGRVVVGGFGASRKDAEKEAGRISSSGGMSAGAVEALGKKRKHDVVAGAMDAGTEGVDGVRRDGEESVSWSDPRGIDSRSASCGGSSSSSSSSGGSKSGSTNGNHEKRNKKKGGVGGSSGVGSGAGKRKKGRSHDGVDPPGAKAYAKTSETSGSSSSSSNSSSSRKGSRQKLPTKVENQEEEGVEERVDRGAGEWEKIRPGGSDRKGKKSRREQQQLSSSHFSSASAVGGRSSVVDFDMAGSPSAPRSKRGPDAIVPSASDSPGPSATVVAEGGGVGDEDEDDEMDWESTVSSNSKHHQTEHLAISEEEEEAIDSDNVDVKAAPCHEGAATPAARSSSSGATSGGRRGGRVAVVPVHPASYPSPYPTPSSASTAELTAAHVLVSGLGV